MIHTCIVMETNNNEVNKWMLVWKNSDWCSEANQCTKVKDSAVGWSGSPACGGDVE